MSADNWRYCPRCAELATREKKENERIAQEAYGNVPHEEYLRLYAKSQEEIECRHTLREDYVFSLGDDGLLLVEYYCSCEACGWSWGHKDYLETDCFEGLG